MPASAPQPKLLDVGPVSSYCQTAQQLLEKFGAAVQELMKLHELQFQSVMAGDISANRFDILIHEANERKQQAKYAYMAHVELHCSSGDYETD